MATKCCPTDVKPAINNYEGIGKKVKIEGHFDMYVVGSSASSKIGIIAVTDLFGVTSNAIQFADCLSASLNGCVVCVPDMLIEPWDPTNVPPTKEGKFPPGVEPADGVEPLINWLMNHYNTRRDRSESLAIVKDYLLKEYSCEKFGGIGLCWGSKVVWTSHLKSNPALFHALASCHGSFMEKSDCERVSVPQCFLNSKDEPPQYASEIKPILESNSAKELNVFKDYPTMHHGWMGTRGIGANTDFTDSEIEQKFREGISDLSNFFSKALA